LAFKTNRATYHLKKTRVAKSAGVSSSQASRDQLPGAKGYFNTRALQGGTDPLWVCEGACAALALLAAGGPRVVAIFGVQGGLWDWVREGRALVFALDADTAGQQQGRQLARQAALRGKQVVILPPEAYGGFKEASEAWGAGLRRQRLEEGHLPCLNTSARPGRSERQS
jgi:hypothetical protein